MLTSVPFSKILIDLQSILFYHLSRKNINPGIFQLYWWKLQLGEGQQNIRIFITAFKHFLMTFLEFMRVKTTGLYIE